MTRNTLRRVEVAVPIYDPDLRGQLNEMFITMLSDNQQARELQSDGIYTRVQSDETQLNSQEFFFAQAYAQVQVLAEAAASKEAGSVK